MPKLLPFYTGCAALLLAGASLHAASPALAKQMLNGPAELVPRAAVPSPLKPVQTIALGPTMALGGSVRLPNLNTVLLLTDTEQLSLRVVCLSAEGRTLWETTAARYLHPKLNARAVFPLPRVQGRTQEDIGRNTLRYDTSTLPISIFTEGNNVVLIERVSAAAAGKLPKGSPLAEGQVYVQRLDEQGHLTKARFEALPTPKPKDSSAEVEVIMGRYADAAGYVEVLRDTEYTKKERIQTFTLRHYDLGASAPRTEPLALPPTTWLTGSFDMFRLWYQDWAFLGHRPNQNYFCRRLLVNSAKERAGNQPLSYQVYIVDDKGAVAPGGFSTILGLSKGTSPMYSGAIPNYGELDYARKTFTVPAHGNLSMPNYNTQTITYDDWQTTGVGSFYLDHATGDVLIFGEYGEGDLPTAAMRPDLLGFFEQRYTFDGKLVDRLQTAYSKPLMAHKKAGSFVGQFGRPVRFHLDPLSGQSQYSFSPMHVMGSGEDFNIFTDRHLQLERIDYVPGKDKDAPVNTTVFYTMPYWLYKPTGTTPEHRYYTHAAPTDPPVYQALAQLHAAASTQPFHEFHLSATGPATGLVVERLTAVGGSLNVYSF